VTVQKQILELLLDLQRERHKAILLITHDLGVVAQVADRVALMYAGELVELADKDAFFAKPLHPYAERLLAALPDVDKRDHMLDAIPGSVPPLNQAFTSCRFAPRCHAAAQRCTSEAPGMFEAAVAHSVRCFGYATDDRVPLAALRVAAPASNDRVVAANPAVRDPLLEVNDLRVRFPIRSGLLRRATSYVEAVCSISFNVRAGETLALVGESGCGKTTSGKAILQLLRGAADLSGSAFLDGVDLMSANREQLFEARPKFKSSFRTPTHHSIRACGLERSWKKE